MMKQLVMVTVMAATDSRFEPAVKEATQFVNTIFSRHNYSLPRLQ